MSLLPDELHDRLLEFRSARDWEQFHTPQNLAIAISVEAGELLEHFQWITPGEKQRDTDEIDAIRLEIADLVILLSYLCNDLNIDPAVAVQEKLAMNERRYSVEKSKGNATKHDKLT